MKVLVTGAAGFIGFHLVEALVKQGVEVVGIDNINDYYDVNLKYARLKESGISKDLIDDSGALLQSSVHSIYRFGKIDITDYGKLEQLFREEKFTHAVNLAAQAGVRYSIENPHAYVQSNLVGFVNILECCRYNEINHLVYASSSSVYGANSKIPFSEDDRVDHPVSLYAATKKSNELMAYTYSHLYKLQTTGLRFFTVYGPWGRPDMAPMLFANSISKGMPIKVFNNGEMERDFTYIDDVIRGIVGTLTLEHTSECKADIFNIGNGNPVNLLDFITIMEQALGKKVDRIFMPMQDGDVKRTWADTNRLNNIKGVEPKIIIAEGAMHFALWYREFYRNIS